jgi:ribonuclease BN (tRNA processing enzyme)
MERRPFLGALVASALPITHLHYDHVMDESRLVSPRWDQGAD